MLCDDETGKFWSVDHKDEQTRFLSYDPEFNTFERYEVSPPPNPFTNEVGLPRGHTERPAMDGWYYWASLHWGTELGSFFRFRPGGQNGPEVESLGVTWGGGMDVLQMGLSPKGRYVYYYPQAYPAPLIQYDVLTGKKKVICWLQDYYFKKYGYYFAGVYSLEISNDGSFIVVCMNGAFQGWGKTYGHPSLIVIHIPEEERQE